MLVCLHYTEQKKGRRLNFWNLTKIIYVNPITLAYKLRISGTIEQWWVKSLAHRRKYVVCNQIFSNLDTV